MRKILFRVVAQIFFILAFWFVAPVQAEESRVYQLPIMEANMVVFEWLATADLPVKNFSSTHGQVVISAGNDSEELRLSLVAHSALATKITAINNQDRQFQGLWTHFAAYLNTLSKQYPSRSRQIPAATGLEFKAMSVVCIKTSIAGETLQLSGFAINSTGGILCTAHDLKVGIRVTVQLHDGREIGGQVIRLDPSRDLALVAVPKGLKPFVPLSDGRRSLREKERLFSIGCPMNVQGVIQAGFFQGSTRRLHGWPLWQVNMSMQPGSSGSPVFDAEGRLVGMAKGRYRGTDSLGFIIPVQTLVDFVREE